MSDILLGISERPQLKGLAKSLGVPVPPVLERKVVGEGYEPMPLSGSKAAVGGFGDVQGVEALLTRLGATSVEPGEEERVHVVCYDARQMSSSQDLDALYAFFHGVVGRLAKGASIVVVGADPEQASSASEAAARGALVGFVKSIMKEVGGRGVRANLVRCMSQDVDLDGIFRFLLSSCSVYVTGQMLEVGEHKASVQGVDGEGVLAGKVVMVTGSAQGIGAATARRFAAEGAHVVCLDLSRASERLVKVADETGGDSLMVDLLSAQAPLRIASFLKSRHGGVDVVVHNAGLTQDRTLMRMKPERWESVLEVNLRAIERVDAVLDREGLFREGASQVYLSSIAGIAGNMGQSNYASAKSGLIEYMKWRSRHASDVRVNAVAPGFIETRMTDEIPLAIREVGRRMNAFSQGGRPEDVAEAIEFLGSGLAEGVRGQVLRVCGGMMLGA